MPDAEDQLTHSRLPRRAALTAMCTLMAVLWLLDVLNAAAGADLDGAASWWRLAPGVVAGVALLMSDRHLGTHGRALLAAFASWVVTLFLLVSLESLTVGWGLVETLSLLLLLVRTARRSQQAWRAAAVCTALAGAVIAAPMRLAESADVLYSFALTFLAGGAVGLGCYLRGLDARRKRAVDDVRQSERLALARELHDFVAHHVTGIVVQAQAARTIRESAPEQVDPLLRGIEQAGSETLDSMRKLVRVLRQEEVRTVRPGELYAELAELVAAFSERDAPATLQVAADARQARPDHEVETSVRNVVREALTNVRRHAPGAPSVLVRVGLTGEGDPHGRTGTGTGTDARRLRVVVHNEAPPRNAPQPSEPLGGRGGLGLIGLAERAEAVGGTLRGGPGEDGGWTLTAEFPVRDAVAGSPA